MQLQSEESDALDVPSSDDSDSWPSTPPSPDRLPSASLVDRLAFSPTEMLPGRCFPDYVPGGSEAARKLVFSEPVHLITQNTDVRMRSLAQCSEPSPVPCTRQTMVEEPKEPSRYPYNLYSLYPSVYPYFDLYPTEGPIVNPQKEAPVCQAQLSSVQLPYPYNLCALYPALYPHFDLYPYQRPLSARCGGTPGQSLKWREAQLECLAYPYSLNAIYPARYPFFDIYPSKETCQLANTVATVNRNFVTPLPPRRKLSTSHLSPIFVDKSKLQGHMMDSPSERFDASGSKDVAEFKKKRGKRLYSDIRPQLKQHRSSGSAQSFR